MAKAFAGSTKKAETSGSTTKAMGEGPKRLATAVMLAMAVGVAPMPNPTKPEESTAARYPPPSPDTAQRGPAPASAPGGRAGGIASARRSSPPLPLGPGVHGAQSSGAGGQPSGKGLPSKVAVPQALIWRHIQPRPSGPAATIRSKP